MNSNLLISNIQIEKEMLDLGNVNLNNKKLFLNEFPGRINSFDFILLSLISENSLSDNCIENYKQENALFSANRCGFEVVDKNFLEKLIKFFKKEKENVDNESLDFITQLLQILYTIARDFENNLGEDLKSNLAKNNLVLKNFREIKENLLLISTMLIWSKSYQGASEVEDQGLNKNSLSDLIFQLKQLEENKNLSSQEKIFLMNSKLKAFIEENSEVFQKFLKEFSNKFEEKFANEFVKETVWNKKEVVVNNGDLKQNLNKKYPVTEDFPENFQNNRNVLLDNKGVNRFHSVSQTSVFGIKERGNFQNYTNNIKTNNINFEVKVAMNKEAKLMQTNFQSSFIKKELILHSNLNINFQPNLQNSNIQHSFHSLESFYSNNNAEFYEIYNVRLNEFNNFVRKITMELLPQGEKRAILNLEPPELGKIELEIKVKNKKVEIIAKVEKLEVFNELRQHIHFIKSELEKVDLQLKDFQFAFNNNFEDFKGFYNSQGENRRPYGDRVKEENSVFTNNKLEDFYINKKGNYYYIV